VKDWLEILASLLGSLARIGFIIALFSAAVIFAESRGINFPATVWEWSSAALVLGLVLIVVEGILPGFRGVSWFFGRLARRRSLKAQWRRRDDEAVKNLRTLDAEEFDLLLILLRNGEKRFQVGTVTSAPRLLQKDILVFVKQISSGLWICELNPAIEQQRDEILKSMETRLGGQPLGIFGKSLGFASTRLVSWKCSASSKSVTPKSWAILTLVAVNRNSDARGFQPIGQPQSRAH
jgi:hypothetical protein